MDGLGAELNDSANNEVVPKNRVLLVDDDSTCLVIIAAWLRKWKYHVVTVTNALDALTTLHAQRGSFDIVVADVHMPLMNGLELLKHVREEFHLPVFLISSDEREDTKKKGFEGGAARYILKSEFPYSWEKSAKMGGKPTGEVGIDAGLTWVCEEDADEYKQIGCQSGEGCSKDVEENVKPLKREKLCWTPELHRKFEAAIHYLGITKATPKKIVEHMKVPGLTRGQVASHLQKYRLYRKRRYEIGIGNHDYLSKFQGVVEDSSLISVLVRMGVVPRNLLLPGREENDFFYRSQHQESKLLVRTSRSDGRADVSVNGILAKGETSKSASVSYAETENPSPHAAMPFLLGSNNTDEISAGFAKHHKFPSMLDMVGAIPRDLQLHERVRNNVLYRLQNQESNFLVQNSLSDGADMSVNRYSPNKGTVEAPSVTHGVSEDPSPHAAMTSLLGSDNSEATLVGSTENRGLSSMLIRGSVIPGYVQLPERGQNDIVYQVQNSLSDGVNATFNGSFVNGGFADVTSITHGRTENMFPHAIMPTLLGSDGTEETSAGFTADRRLTSMFDGSSAKPRNVQLPEREQNGVLYQPWLQENQLVQNSLSDGADASVNGLLMISGSTDVSSVTHGVTENPTPRADVPSLLESKNAEEISAGFIESCLQDDEVVDLPQQNEDMPGYSSCNDCCSIDEVSCWLMDPINAPSQNLDFPSQDIVDVHNQQNENIPDYSYSEGWWNGDESSSCLMNLINASFPKEDLTNQSIIDLPDQVDDCRL